MTSASRPTVLAVAAHADDIEFMMGGTLVLLAQRDWDVHYVCVANGYAGTARATPEEIVLTRVRESQQGARILGATWHSSLVNDAEITYSVDLLRRLTALVRQVRPAIVLTQAPDDYMEDHVETSRLATSAAFNRGMPNFQTLPPTAAYSNDVVVYHALPHGLRDPLRRLVYPGMYVNTESVHETKAAALAAHHSQHGWLSDSQDLGDGLTAEMDRTARLVGRMSRKYSLAEGWRQHNHVGFAAADANPLADALSDVVSIDEDIEESLTAHPVTGRPLVV